MFSLHIITQIYHPKSFDTKLVLFV